MKRSFDRYLIDKEGHPILGGSNFVGVINQTINASTWTLISMPINMYCKQMLIKERNSESWKLSVKSGGHPFFTVDSPIGIEIAKKSEEVLFYAQMINGNGTIEILLID